MDSADTTSADVFLEPPWVDVFKSPHFPTPPKKLDTLTKCRLLFSFMVFLNITVRDFILFLFESTIPQVHHKAGFFLTYKIASPDDFGPARLYKAWHDGFEKSRPHLHSTIVKPCAEEIVLKESDAFITDPKYKLAPKHCTVDNIMEVLDPGRLAAQYQETVPFTWSLLQTFTASPNRYRKYNMQKTQDTAEEMESFLEDNEEIPEQFSGSTGAEWFGRGFYRNPICTLVFVISMMAFTRNSASNLLAVISGLFFEIGGTNARVFSALSNAGMCVSISTIERLKKILSDDAKRKAVDLMKGPSAWFIIFDNINMYLRRFQQRIFNQNSMIHATNAAVISLPDVDPATLSLKQKLANRGKRKVASGADILPTPEDEKIIHHTYIGLVMHLILSYCPDSKIWDRRDEMLKLADSMVASDRPLPPVKTDARPLGVYDINEGSKKGILAMLKALQETSTRTVADWSSRVLIMAGDYLTTSNLRSVRRDRSNDINAMERVEYVEDISQLFHFALNASHMLMRLHLGNAILDPGSLAKHKGLLNRNWDANKPNYADGKALIRHSLIARILYGVMLKENINSFSDLSSWRPTPEELKDFSTTFVLNHTTANAACDAKAVGDDFLAHSIYFIRDALLFCEFEHAVSFADAGRVLRVLKYWCLSFRGANLHNYARECLEITLRWKYELDPPLRDAMEKSWFVNRWGLPGRWIAADLYVEQLNFWVKRVFIAKGSGVTVQYIIEKGSACVEVFRELSHKFSRAFGDPDRARRHKELKVDHDLRLLCEDMLNQKLHIKTPNRHILTPPTTNSKGKVVKEAESAIKDSFALGVQALNNNKFKDFLRATTFDPAVGFQGSGEDDNIFTRDTENVFLFDELDDIDDGDDTQQRCTGTGGLGGVMDSM